MKELLETYSIQEIIFFIVLLATALKGGLSWIDWAKERLGAKIEKVNEQNKVKENLRSDMEKLTKEQREISEKIDKIVQVVDLLKESDKDDIKAWITREHHYFVYQLGYIDDFNLDCIEKRYTHYKDEGGNSFIAALMEEIRALPKNQLLILEKKHKMKERDNF